MSRTAPVAGLQFARWPQDDDELWEFVATVWGLEIPRERICRGHVPPFEAFSRAFFAREPITVWKASRTFGGKTTLLSLLALTELVVLGAEIRLLGGSGEQAARVHEYMGKRWDGPFAPRHLIVGEPTATETVLSNGGKVEALMASQRSVRGPHPQRLRLDEVDETEIPILDAALGQTMAAGQIPAQTVLSSTHHNPDGTMTEVLRRAKEQGWPVYEWCYRETLQPHGWLPQSEVDRKRGELTAQVWQTEVELQEPSAEARAIVPEAVEEMFDKGLGQVQGEAGRYFEFESPVGGGVYATGADWARDVNWTVIWTWRTDVRPWRLVAFRRDGRRPWPQMVEAYCQQVRRFPGFAAHDVTGLGGVIEDLLTVNALDVDFTNRKQRQAIFAEYVAAIERKEFKAPRVEYAYGEHKYVRNDDLYGSGHPPDSFVAAALARWVYYHAPRQAVYVGYKR